MKKFNPKIEPDLNDKNQGYEISLEFVRDLIDYDALNMVHDALIQSGYKEMVEVINALQEYIDTEDAFNEKKLFLTVIEKLNILNEKHGTETNE